ncbi:MAG: bifunctional lysylphosphatidylglycerol flippase/synthetase MprF [Desulfobulbaceae bacterium]|nr:bifunctional lysylphosphatidylglycerol flippase/synthetase MprF [Desulfobulbaceae bacterium]
MIATQEKTHSYYWVKNAFGFIGVALFFVAFGVIHQELKIHSYHEVRKHLSGYSSMTLLSASVLTIVNYLVLTAYDGLAIRYLGKTIELWKMILTSFIAYVFSYNIGLSVFGGTAIRYRMYSAFGFSTADIAKIVAFNVLSLWVGFFALAGCVFLFEPLAIKTHFSLPFDTVRPLGGLFLLIVFVYLVWSWLGDKSLQVGKWTIALPSNKYTTLQVLLSSVDWMLASAVLYVLMPSDLPFSFFGFLAIFLLAQLAGLASHVPGGVGIFESVVLFFFVPSIPAAEILAALFAYRAIYYFLPLLFAMLLLVGYELIRRQATLKRSFELFDRLIRSFVPQVFAVTIFLTGIILLVSGATPAGQGRLHWLRGFVPLPVIEISHFMGSLAGVALLFVAWGLYRRLNAAYVLSVGLLAGGVVFSVLKGFDYEEAIILSLMLVSILPCRHFFYRKTALVDEPLTVGWFIAIAGVVTFSIWLGNFSYKNIAYSNDLWWKFQFSAEAPRFLRTTVGVVTLAFFLAFSRLFRPPHVAQNESSVVDFEKIRSVARLSAKTSANLALLGDKRFFMSASGESFLMYGVEGRSWVVLGDPVGREEEWPDLIWKFHEYCDQHNGWPVFYEVGHVNLYLYADLGLMLLKIGEEARVLLTEYSLDGSSRKHLRHVLNRCDKEGLIFRIIPASEVPSVLPELQQISDLWLAEKNTREKGFSLGFFDEAYLKNFPIAIIEKGNRILAFANVWADAHKTELSLDLMRYLPEAPAGIMEYLFLKMMLWGKCEGYQWFSLGMVPLSGFQSHPLAPFWNKVGGFIFRHGENFYNFEGLRAYKDKFGPVWEPRYMALPTGLQLPRIFSNVTVLIAGGIKGVLSK